MAVVPGYRRLNEGEPSEPGELLVDGNDPFWGAGFAAAVIVREEYFDASGKPHPCWPGAGFQNGARLIAGIQLEKLRSLLESGHSLTADQRREFVETLTFVLDHPKFRDVFYRTKSEKSFGMALEYHLRKELGAASKVAVAEVAANWGRQQSTVKDAYTEHREKVSDLVETQVGHNLGRMKYMCSLTEQMQPVTSASDRPFLTLLWSRADILRAVLLNLTMARQSLVGRKKKG